MNNQQAANIRRRQEAGAIWESRKPDIVRMYREDRMSQQAIADHYGVSLAGMQKAMARLGIKPKPKHRSGSENGRYKHGRASTAYRKLVNKKSCAICGATTNLCVHHKNGDHLDNRKANLEVQCMSCHSREHKLAWWDARRDG